MRFVELLLLAVGLSMDAFAVAVCLGLALDKATLKRAGVVGLYFGVFQAVMPAIGYLAAALFASKIIAYDHWVAFALLGYLGGAMLFEGLKKDKTPDAGTGGSLKPAHMLPLALATSIDALAVGVSFAFLKVSIVPAVVFIGAVTFVFSAAGVKIGNVFGARFKPAAQLAGGVILMLIGVKILLEHLGVIGF
jgi:putative Mn2+ efflux pump MntP